MILLAAMMLSGCVMMTVDELYCLPKRSQADDDMQAVIDHAMTGLSYCAPIYGQNRQMVQPADLDGDGSDEYVVLGRDSARKQLRILIIDQFVLGYELTDTIQGYGAAFDFIEFADVDGYPGAEIVVGRQVGDGSVCSVAVYRYENGKTHQLLEAAYSKFLTFDLDEDGRSELLAIHPAEAGNVTSNAVLYRYEDGRIHRAAQLEVSVSAGNVTRMEQVTLQDGTNAVLVVSEESNSQIMELLAFQSGHLKHVYGPAMVYRLRDHFIYPMDVDSDGDIDLPEILPMQGKESEDAWIIWFGVDGQGRRVNGMYTYYSYASKWYIHVDRDWINKLVVTHTGGICTFNNQNGQMVMTIYTLTGPDRKEQAQQLGGVVLGSSETITFVATVGPGAEALGISEQRVKQLFYAINLKLYTEEA